MSRFYIPPSAIRGKSFVLSGSEARHALHVLRKKVGDEIDLFDGKDASYKGRIDSVASREIRGTILENLPPKSLSIQVTLFQALAKGPKWEWLLEKACEIGVTRIVPVLTQRTLIKLDASQAREKLKRWNRIALAASKQCGRADLLTVEAPLALSKAFQSLDKNDLSLIPWEKESNRSIHEACQISPSPQPSTEKGEGDSIEAPSPLRGRGSDTQQSLASCVASKGEGAAVVNVFIGPEGGWDPAEIELAVRSHVVPVRLGPTLLRTETAGLVAATLVLREFGVYGPLPLDRPIS